MNTTKPPECWASDANARALRVETAPGRALLLPFDQFVFAECHTEAKEQRFRLVFATHEVVVRGHSLRRIETALQPSLPNKLIAFLRQQNANNWSKFM